MAADRERSEEKVVEPGKEIRTPDPLMTSEPAPKRVQFSPEAPRPTGVRCRLVEAVLLDPPGSRS
jgi:hypothetical protein